MTTQTVDLNKVESDAQVSVVDNAVSVKIADTTLNVEIVDTIDVEGTVDIGNSVLISGSVITTSTTIIVPFTGQIDVTTAGVPVRGPNILGTNGFYIKGHVDNTDTVHVFDWGKTKASGYPLNAGEQIHLNVINLNEAGFDADVSGEDVCWLKA